jgi:WD40 repeat protein
MLGSFQ